VQKLEILCNTEVLIFTIFHYTIVIQASIVTSQIHYQILEFHYVLCKINCLFKWNGTEKFCFISLNTFTAVQRISYLDFSLKPAVFGCLANVIAPPPIALESCSWAQTDRQFSSLHSK